MLNNIKNKYILGIVFKNVKTKIKMKLIKHNKYMLERLNITEEDFITCVYIKEFNKKCNMDINDNHIKELNLNKKIFNNIKFKFQSFIRFEIFRIHSI